MNTYDAPLVAPGERNLLNFDNARPAPEQGMHFYLDDFAEMGVLEPSGRWLLSFDDFRTALEQHYSLLSELGTVAQTTPLRDPARGDSLRLAVRRPVPSRFRGPQTGGREAEVQVAFRRDDLLRGFERGRPCALTVGLGDPQLLNRLVHFRLGRNPRLEKIRDAIMLQPRLRFHRRGARFVHPHPLGNLRIPSLDFRPNHSFNEPAVR